MKVLRNGFMLGLFLVAVITLASAQPGGGRGRMNIDPDTLAHRQTVQMSEQLELSEAQANKVGEVNLAFAKKMKVMREEADGDFSGMREKMQAMQAEQKTELKKYLTTEQFEKWEKIQVEQRAQRGQRGEGRRRGDGGRE